VNVVQIVTIVVPLVIGLALIGRTHRLERPRPFPEIRVSLVIPARDEATRLPTLLAAIADLPLHEVIVVDDSSTDATAALAIAAGATVLEAGPPPEGWTGKAWACARGAAAATGDVLAFFDADVEPTPDGVAALAAAAWETGALVSAQPGHRIAHVYELASAGPALVTLLGAGTGTSVGMGRWRGPIAFGPAIAIRRDAYQSFGGHGAVRGAIDDDLALARAATGAGLPVRALLGDPLLRYRMYPDGLAQLVEGWTKNLATGAGNIPRLRLVACVVWIAGALSAAVELAGASRVLAAAVYAAFAFEARTVLRRSGRFGPLPWLLYPASLIGFLALFARSTYETLRRREVQWRGRAVAVGRRS